MTKTVKYKIEERKIFYKRSLLCLFPNMRPFKNYGAFLCIYGVNDIFTLLLLSFLIHVGAFDSAFILVIIFFAEFCAEMEEKAGINRLCPICSECLSAGKTVCVKKDMLTLVHASKKRDDKWQKWSNLET